MPYSAVLFDLDGTLYDRDALAGAIVPAQFSAFERDLVDVTKERFVRDVLEMDDHGNGDKAEGYRRLVRDWGLRNELADQLEDYFWSNYDSHCRLSDDTRTTLQTLRDHRKKLGVITNGYSGQRQRRKLEALGLLTAFDAVLISAEEGVRKPDIEIFRRAVARCGVEPHEAAFVGDHPQADVEGARNAGLLPIWKFVPYWLPSPRDTLTVERLTEILPICLD